MQIKKKAKLAHEKRSSQQDSKGRGRFTFVKVLEVVETSDNAMSAAAIVDVDGRGTLAMVDRWYVTQEKETGIWHPSGQACPVAYDTVARAKAIEAYEQYTQRNQQAVASQAEVTA